MRTIEKAMVQAVKEHRNFSRSNTSVKVDGANVYVRLHGNLIYKVENGVRSFTLSTWNSVTTRSRLRALGVDLHTIDYRPYWGDKEIDIEQWYNI